VFPRLLRADYINDFAEYSPLRVSNLIRLSEYNCNNLQHDDSDFPIFFTMTINEKLNMGIPGTSLELTAK
jgi:hypothetical protein